METQQLENGKWVEAKPLVYQPNIIERLLHLFGIHQWTYTEPKKCVMCGKQKEVK